MSVFSNREIASAVWMTAFVLFALCQPPVRESLVGVAKALFRPQILIPGGLMALYGIGLVTCLRMSRLWDPSLTKDTIICVLAGIITAFDASATPSIERLSFGRVVRASLRAMIVVEFLLSRYTFPLLGELILVPTLTFVMMVDVVAKSKEEYSAVVGLTSFVQACTGWAIFALVIARAIGDYRSLGTLDAVKSLLLVPVLTILLWPCAYFLALYASYDTLFARLKMGSAKASNLRHFMRTSLIKKCWFSLWKVRSFLGTPAYDLSRAQTEDEVRWILDATSLSRQSSRVSE